MLRLERLPYVQIDPRDAVLGVAKVERELPLDVPHADGGDTIAERRLLEPAVLLELVERDGERDETSGDGRRPRPAVGLEHVAVDHHAALSELVEIERRPERAPHEPLDLPRPAAERPLPPVPRFPALRVRAGVHLVLGRDPALAPARHELRDGVVHRSGGQDQRSARTVEG
jgi:hypothetical protein